MSKNTAFDFTATSKRVTEREVAVARLATDYAALVTHFNLTTESDSKTITNAARMVVLTGAHASGTRVGEALVEGDLKGTDPGADAKHRDYWKAARAVRIGLVTAIGKKSEEKAPTLRVTMSGEGGGTAVVPTDHPLYADILALIGANK